MNPGDMLVIGEWTLLQLGNVQFLRDFSKCRKWNNRENRINFVCFPNISRSNELRGRSSHWEMNTSGIAQGQTFSNFLRVGNETTEKTKKINFWVLSLYLVQINQGDVLVIAKLALLEVGNFRIFRNFSKCRKRYSGENSKN